MSDGEGSGKACKSLVIVKLLEKLTFCCHVFATSRSRTTIGAFATQGYGYERSVDS